MPFEVAKKLIDALLDSKENSINKYIKTNETIGVVLDFIGGEPFLEVDLID